MNEVPKKINWPFPSKLPEKLERVPYFPDKPEPINWNELEDAPFQSGIKATRQLLFFNEGVILASW